MEAPTTLKMRESVRQFMFIIEASQCELRLGDHVTPETVIGKGIKTGEVMMAGCHGQVKAITFDPFNHALLVVIATNEV
jgi:hypothetical protein